MCVWKDNKKLKRGRGWPIFLKKWVIRSWSRRQAGTQARIWGNFNLKHFFGFFLIFKNGPSLASFSFIFRFFQTNNRYYFHSKSIWKMIHWVFGAAIGRFAIRLYGYGSNYVGKTRTLTFAIVKWTQTTFAPPEERFTAHTLSSLLQFFICHSIPTYLPTYLPSYLPYLPYVPTYLPTLPTLPTYLPTYLPTLPTLPTYLPTYLTYLTYLPTYLVNKWNSNIPSVLFTIAFSNTNGFVTYVQCKYFIIHFNGLFLRQLALFNQRNIPRIKHISSQVESIINFWQKQSSMLAPTKSVHKTNLFHKS